MHRPRPIQGFRKLVNRSPAIREVVREPTAGGIIYRQSPLDGKTLEILLIADSKGRWTIPKGHIEEGETPRQTAQREINEETGLKKMDMQDRLGKINFRYRRENTLVLMTTEIFLVRAQGDTSDITPQEWMKDIAWMPVNQALEKIAYDDIGKLILLGLKKIRGNER